MRPFPTACTLLLLGMIGCRAGTEHEDLIVAAIANANEMAAVIESIKDKDSAEAAKVRGLKMSRALARLLEGRSGAGDEPVEALLLSRPAGT